MPYAALFIASGIIIFEIGTVVGRWAVVICPAFVPPGVHDRLCLVMPQIYAMAKLMGDGFGAVSLRNHQIVGAILAATQAAFISIVKVNIGRIDFKIPVG